MAALVTGKDVEMVLRAALAHEGYKISKARGHGETGSDIVAQRGSENLHIEAIAFKEASSNRAKDFFEVFFRAVSRLQDGATSCVIALPSRFGMGLSQRAKAIGPAWCRIGDSFPELEIWLVDTTDGSIKRAEWNSWSRPKRVHPTEAHNNRDIANSPNSPNGKDITSDDQLLEKLLGWIGKECFVILCNNESCTDDYLREGLMNGTLMNREGYTRASSYSRVSRFRRIVREGRRNDALKLIKRNK